MARRPCVKLAKEQAHKVSSRSFGSFQKAGDLGSRVNNGFFRGLHRRPTFGFQERAALPGSGEPQPPRRHRANAPLAIVGIKMYKRVSVTAYLLQAAHPWKAPRQWLRHCILIAMA